ncbi:MAG TPA: nitrogen regulation protein NR(II) [Gammaproteobacteria bacterium]|nr:nitrogen regulation protein NR(II) [Gammaproteobacteria bacterium]
MHTVGAISDTLRNSLLENQTTALLWLDTGLIVRYLNPAAETLLGLDTRQVLGAELLAVLPEAGELRELLLRAQHSGETCTRRELNLGTASHSLTVDLTVTPVTESGRAPELLVEMAPLDRHLHISREQELHTRHATARALALRLAHEVKNPLGGLRGAAQLLERKLDDARLREYTRLIIREADRLAALADSLLGPNRPPQRVLVNLHEISDHVLRLLEAEHTGRIVWLRDYDPSLPEIRLDRDEIVQLLLNLARNACEALNGRGRIALRTRCVRQYTLNGVRHRLAARLDVEDDGPGIPPALQASLFTPLVSGKPHGTGLGLAIAQELANRHGGLIECSSRPGATVFSVLLPIGDT